MNAKILTGLGLVIAVVLFLAVNIISNIGLRSARLDMTENNLYTLSEGSRNILSNLSEPITLRFYLSEKLATGLPGISSYATRVRELLEEYERTAGSKLDLKIIDPEPFSEAEDRAVGYGLQGVPIDNNNTTFYFGLVGTNSADGEEIITFFQPNREEFLEYDLTELVSKLDTAQQSKVGLMTALPIEGGAPAMPFMQQAGGDPWMIVQQIRQGFEVQTVATEVDTIPADISVLMVVHPKALSDTTLYAIDQFVLNGGRVLAFVDPYSEADEPPRDPNNPFASMQAPRNSTLGKLFDAWGVELVDSNVVGDMTTAKKVQARIGQQIRVVNYPVWMDLNTSNFDPDDIITGKLGDLTIATAGVLKAKEGAATTFQPLLTTSEQAMQINTSKLGMFADPQAMVREFKPAGEKFTIAARVSGKVSTAFPGGKPEKPATEGEETPPPADGAPQLTESKEDINVIIMADTDFLQDRFWVNVQNFLGQRIAIPQASNADFVVNALENLGGSNDLISVRNRGSFSRPFTKVAEIQRDAEEEFREKEEQLQERLKEAEQKLRELQSQKQDGSSSLILSPAQQQEIEKFQGERLKVRKELRNVQHALNQDIESLESRMMFLNVALAPFLVAVGGIGLSYYRNRRRREAANEFKLKSKE
ncbi:MAG: Gldg family protein [Pseudomonadota bacterium]